MEDKFTPMWRTERVEMGDALLDQAAELMTEFNNSLNPGTKMDRDAVQLVYGQAELLVAMAQAHYMAANVRQSRA